LRFFFILQLDNCKTSVLAALDVDRDVALLDLEAFEEVNDSAFVCSPRETA